jgi:hypothetical protein
MKITKQQLKQIIKEELEASEELLDALHKLTSKIDDLDVSVDYLAAAMTGDDALSIGAAQRGLGRAARAPSVKIQKENQIDEMAGPPHEIQLKRSLMNYVTKMPQIPGDEGAPPADRIVNSLWDTMMGSLVRIMPAEFKSEQGQIAMLKNLLQRKQGRSGEESEAEAPAPDIELPDVSPPQELE